MNIRQAVVFSGAALLAFYGCASIGMVPENQGAQGLRGQLPRGEQLPGASTNPNVSQPTARQPLKRSVFRLQSADPSQKERAINRIKDRFKDSKNVTIEAKKATMAWATSALNYSPAEIDSSSEIWEIHVKGDLEWPFIPTKVDPSTMKTYKIYGTEAIIATDPEGRVLAATMTPKK